MKVFLIIFLFLDLVLVAGAAIRFTTATTRTTPFVDFMGRVAAEEAAAASARENASAPGGGRAGDSEAMDFMKSTNPNQGKDMAIESQLGTAIEVEENREQDLLDAKLRIKDVAN